MDTSIYRYVTAIAECGSISSAAKKLFISQPALTKQLGRVEASLGYKLFDRSRFPIVPTPEGEIFLEYALRYLTMEEEMNRKMNRVQCSDEMYVQVATTHRGGTYVGMHTMPFLKEYPQIQVEYLDNSAKECEEALEKEEVEMAVYTDPIISDQIEYMPLEEDSLILVLPRNSSVFQGRNIEGNDLDHLYEIEPEWLNCPDLTFVLSTPNHSLYFAECALFKKYKIHPAHSIRVDYVDTRYQIARCGGGVILVPKTTIEKTNDNPDVVYATLKGGQPYRYVVIAKKRGCLLSRAAELYWKFMVSHKFQDYNK